MTEHVHYLKPERGKRSKGRARPDEPLAAFCEIGVFGVCAITPTHRHHRLMRSQGGTDDASNTLDVCEPCHTFCHANRIQAREQGWILTPGGDAA